MNLIRVKYGKKEQSAELREYQINGSGPVGTIEEFKRCFPTEELNLIDDISK